MDQITFDMLNKELDKDTGFSSNMKKMIDHWAWQEIRSEGRQSVPYILLALQDEAFNPSFLYMLKEIFGFDAAHQAKTIHEARDLWIQWGHEAGYFS